MNKPADSVYERQGLSEKTEAVQLRGDFAEKLEWSLELQWWNHMWTPRTCLSGLYKENEDQQAALEEVLIFFAKSDGVFSVITIHNDREGIMYRELE